MVAPSSFVSWSVACRSSSAVKSVLFSTLNPAPAESTFTKRVQIPVVLTLNPYLNPIVIVWHDLLRVPESGRDEPYVYFMPYQAYAGPSSRGRAADSYVRRFRDGCHATSYLGLVPITRQSGDHFSHHRIMQVGSSQARWLLTKSCQHPGPHGAFFRRLAKRKNRQVAIVAVAWKLVTIIYLKFKNNEPYRYVTPTLMSQKFVALDRAQRDDSNEKNDSRRIAVNRSNLAEVFEYADLPPVTLPKQLSPGERRILKERKLTTYGEELFTPATVSARKRTPPK